MRIDTPPAEISDDILMLGTSPYPAYLLHAGTEAALVEGTIGAMGPLVVEQLERLGVGRERVRRILVTHAHPDHVMALPHFRERFPEARVAASGAAARTLAIEKAVAFFTRIDGMLTESLLRAGTIEGHHRPSAAVGATIPIDDTVDEGDTIAAGGLELRVLATPGHSDCSTSFFEPERRLLLSADVTPYHVARHDYWWPNYFAGYADYVASIERVAALGAEIVCPGHTAAMRGADAVRDFFARALAATRAYHERIVGETRRGRAAAEIADALAEEVFALLPPLLPRDFFRKNCALLVRQSLEHEGIGEAP